MKRIAMVIPDDYVQVVITRLSDLLHVMQDFSVSSERNLDEPLHLEAPPAEALKAFKKAKPGKRNVWVRRASIVSKNELTAYLLGLKSFRMPDIKAYRDENHISESRVRSLLRELADQGRLTIKGDRAKGYTFSPNEKAAPSAPETAFPN